MVMKCPKCDKEMKFIRNDISNNAKKGEDYKEYKRSLFQCKKDDIWVNIEIPK